MYGNSYKASKISTKKKILKKNKILRIVKDKHLFICNDGFLYFLQ